MKSFIGMSFFLGLIIVAPLRADDFFITEYPDAYRMLDGYQQKMTKANKTRFAQNSPWKIVQHRMFLSDGFTQVMKVTGAGTVYYFVLDAQGKVVKSASSHDRYFKQCRQLNDTVQVVRGKTALFSGETTNPGMGARRYLSLGEKLFRVFRWKNRDFVHPLSGNRYGWLTLLNKQGLKHVAHFDLRAKQNGDHAQVLKNIRNKIRETNKIYKKIFRILNARFKKQRTIPFAQIIDKADGWDIVFLPVDEVNAFVKSRHYFNEKIRGALWNSGYVLTEADGSLKIRRKKSNEK